MEIGEKINHLTLIKDIGIKGGRHWGLFQCDCGNIKEIRIDHVKSGNNKACGCQQYQATYGNTKHGLCNTRIYNIWQKMKSRCYSKNDIEYKRYGARGIKVCDEWINDIKAFYDWSISNGYDDNLSIDRIDNNGNYEPSNCRWATPLQQANNCRTNLLITIDDETKTLSQWCRQYNTPYYLAHSRWSRGWRGKEVFSGSRGVF